MGPRLAVSLAWPRMLFKEQLQTLVLQHALLVLGKMTLCVSLVAQLALHAQTVQ